MKSTQQQRYIYIPAMFSQHPYRILCGRGGVRQADNEKQKDSDCKKRNGIVNDQFKFEFVVTSDD